MKFLQRYGLSSENIQEVIVFNQHLYPQNPHKLKIVKFYQRLLKLIYKRKKYYHLNIPKQKQLIFLKKLEQEIIKNIIYKKNKKLKK